MVRGGTPLDKLRGCCKSCEWLKDFTNISGDEEDYQDGAIIGETYYQIEIFDNANEEHRDAMA